MSPVVGRGWATIDSSRAEREVRERGAIGPWEDAVRCSWLGARCRRAPVSWAGRGDGDWIVVLEPDTEGRLAGFLARHGEGWAVTWSKGASAIGALEPRPGPLGPEVLDGAQPTNGPFRLLVVAATIEP